jgi:hypothetical protein
MVAQDPGERVDDDDIAPGAGRLEADSLAVTAELVADAEVHGREVDVLPGEAERFGDPQPLKSSRATSTR